MKNLIEVVTNKLLNEVVDTAVREAVKLQKKANDEYAKQCELRDNSQPYSFTMKHTLCEGVGAVCDVLWRIFGGYPIDSINAIEKIASANESQTLGYDCQDYVALFVDALEEVRKQ